MRRRKKFGISRYGLSIPPPPNDRVADVFRSPAQDDVPIEPLGDEPARSQDPFLSNSTRRPPKLASA